MMGCLAGFRTACGLRLEEVAGETDRAAKLDAAGPLPGVRREGQDFAAYFFLKTGRLRQSIGLVNNDSSERCLLQLLHKLA